MHSKPFWPTKRLLQPFKRPSSSGTLLESGLQIAGGNLHRLHGTPQNRLCSTVASETPVLGALDQLVRRVKGLVQADAEGLDQLVRRVKGLIHADAEGPAQDQILKLRDRVLLLDGMEQPRRGEDADVRNEGG